MRRLRIRSDGTSAGTSVVDAETGEPLAHVTGISWDYDVGSLPMAEVRVFVPDVDLIGWADDPDDEQASSASGK